MNRHVKILLLALACLFSGLTMLRAQEQMNPEAEYFRIRSLAFSGDHQKAACEARKLVNAFPAYGDARILLARITAWQNKYGEASAILDTLLQQEPRNCDALSLKKDIEGWSKNTIASGTGALAGYSFDAFSEPYSRFWSIYRAGISKKLSHGNASALLNIGRLNAGDPMSVKATEWQVEAEAYPELSEKSYTYVSYAFSPGNYFPRHRGALELWQVLPQGWAVSAGLNYFRFDRNIFIAGISAEKYIGSYWLSGKMFVYFKDEGPTTSGFLNARKYFNDFDYLQVTVGAGTAPDEPFDVKTDIMRLSATGLRVAWNKKIRNGISIRTGAGYSSEEFGEAVHRNRFEGSIMLTVPIR